MTAVRRGCVFVETYIVDCFRMFCRLFRAYVSQICWIGHLVALLSPCDPWYNLTLKSLLIFTLDDLFSRWTLVFNPVIVCVSWQVELFTLKVIVEKC